MHYFIYCKEKNIYEQQRAAIEEYQKRLSTYCKTDFILHPANLVPAAFHEANHQIAYITRGLSTYTSIDFSKQIQKYEQSGKSNLHIYIGYSAEEIYQAFEKYPDILPDFFCVSNSNLSAQTLCVLLFEQIYRSYTIINGKIYHK